jgi:D-glycero-D-manno-heptose 1,7-bisphosphate phosphatase
MSASHHIKSGASALFLDRDGVINVDHGYVYRAEQFEFIPGIFELARFWVNEVRRPIVVVTNQAGIGRGYFNEGTYADLTRWMCARFEAERAPSRASVTAPIIPCTASAITAAIIHGESPIPG